MGYGSAVIEVEAGEPVGSLRFDRSILFVTLAIGAIVAAMAFNPAIFNDGDTSWHIAAGQWILGHHTVPATDPFSFTFAGAPWHAHEWLAEVIMAGLFAIGGWKALAVMTAAATAALLVIIGQQAIRRLEPAPAVAVVVTLALVLMPFVVARPHVLAWPVLAGWIVLLLDAREKKRAPPLTAALLMIVWANLHASFLLGLGIAAYFAFEALVHDVHRARTLNEWGLFGLASLAACLVAAHPISGLLYPLQVSQMQSLPLIGEWRATDLREFPAFAAALAAVAVAGIALRSRISPLRLLLLAGLAYLAMKHARHQPVFVIVAALVLVRAFEYPRAPSASEGAGLWKAGLMLFLAIAAVRAAIPVERPDSDCNPLTAIAHIPPQLRTEPVLNSYGFGGPLILVGLRPYIDGRGDMYGDDFMFRHQRLMRGDMQEFRRAATRWRLKWTIISPLDPLSRRLDREPGWRRIYADRWAVIHVAG